MADILTKGMFSVSQWKALLSLIQIGPPRKKIRSMHAYAHDHTRIQDQVFLARLAEPVQDTPRMELEFQNKILDYVKDKLGLPQRLDPVFHAQAIWSRIAQVGARTILHIVPQRILEARTGQH